MNIRIINRSKNNLPAYETPLSAGMDLRADVESLVIIKPLARTLIPTGLYMELPEGFEAQIRPRSGLAYKYGIGLVNSPGTIDADYRGEIKVLLVNLSDQDFEINAGDRIAQMIIAKHERADWQEVEVLNETARGAGGYGHTGVQ
ncbi:MAG: dUTP diphosphatase [Sphingobacteriaceae bacterium]